MGIGELLPMPVALILVALLTVRLGLTQLMSVGVMKFAAAQPSVKGQAGALGPKPNEYYIFTQELNANELILSTNGFALVRLQAYKLMYVTVPLYRPKTQGKTSLLDDVVIIRFRFAFGSAEQISPPRLLLPV